MLLIVPSKRVTHSFKNLRCKFSIILKFAVYGPSISKTNPPVVQIVKSSQSGTFSYLNKVFSDIHCLPFFNDVHKFYHRSKEDFCKCQTNFCPFLLCDFQLNPLYSMQVIQNEMVIVYYVPRCTMRVIA